MYTYNAKLERIIDGDSIVALVDLGFDIWKKVNIRMYGMNTPESRTRDLEEKARGLAAKNRLAEILELENEGEFILVSHGVGKYGRCLGEIYVENTYNDNPNLPEISVNRILINEGHAKEYYGGKR